MHQPFAISLAQWSLHRAHQDGSIDPIEFPTIAKQKFGIDGVEYVNTFFPNRHPVPAFVEELLTRCRDDGVTSVLIMCDHEGNLGDPDEHARARAIENHYKWIDAAATLGCHSIRVNAKSEGTPEEQRRLVTDGLRQLTEHAATRAINVLVENHGGLSSNGKWLASVIRNVDHPRCGTLPDFGNFYLNWETKEMYDRYMGVAELMPFAKSVSAKSNDFNAAGNEIHTDYTRMMKIVLDAGYRGWVGVEYEGTHFSEFDGITATRDLLLQIRTSMECKV